MGSRRRYLVAQGSLSLLLAAACAAALESPTTSSSTPSTPSTPSTIPASVAPAEFEELLGQLDSPSFAEREAAERALLAAVVATPDLLSHVERSAGSHESAEVRARCRAVMHAVEELYRFGTSRITIQLEQVPAREAADALLEAIEQSMRDALGDEVPLDQLPRYWPEDDPFQGDVNAATRLVDVEVVDVPLWEAVEIVGRATGIWLVEHQAGFAFSRHGQPFQGHPRSAPPETQAGMALNASGDVAAVVELTGAYRNASNHLSLVRDPEGNIRGGPGRGRSSLTLQIRMLVEPKIQLADGQVQLFVDQAIDEMGHDLLDDATVRRSGSSSNNGWSVQVNVPLDATLSRDSERVEVLTGFIEFDVASETAVADFDVAEVVESLRERVNEREEEVGEEAMEQEIVTLPVGLKANLGDWEVELVEAASHGLPQHVRDARRGGANLQIDPAHGNLSQIRFTLRLQGSEAAQAVQDWTRMQRLLRGMMLVDAEGLAWQMSQQDQSLDQETQTMTLTLTFNNWNNQGQSPARLLWRVPVDTRPLRIPFEFHDIPLPKLQ